jgi:hypothetical protein
MAQATPRAGDGASTTDRPANSAGEDDPSGEPSARAFPGRDTARHLAGQLSALPRLAAAGAARVRARSHTSAAERAAERREEALEAAELGPGTDWGQVGVFGAGIAIGALIGAGAALLLAPATGFETRTRLASTARRRGARVADQFDDLTDDVRRGARRGKQKVSRAVTASRWAAEDAWERRRRERD